ncbi:hypothetical protein ACHWQZ_G003746 [Mnemiopsis leidyi]
MVKAFNKKESKRMTCHKKYKIRKKVREHNKKLAKTLKNSIKKKRKIDGSIPNLAPFKEELLLEAVNQNEIKSEQKKQKKKNPPTVVTKSAVQTSQAISAKSVSSHITISQCDIIVWVIDIRSAKECFCEETFSELTNAKKTVVFVLNKVDLVPKSVAYQWYSVYSKRAPTFVLKSTEIILTECEQIITALKTSLARFGGAKPLLAHLKESSTEAEKKIGVIGGPQVGKSCVISTILKQCGRTKAKKATETKLSETLKLVTVPGLIKMEYKGVLNVLNNIHQYMNHPTEVLTALAHCITKQDAMFHFTLPNYKHPEGLPDALAVRYNLYFQKEPDHEAVGRLVLKQFRDKKLKFYVACEDSDDSVNIPDDQIGDVHRLLFEGDALRLNSSELNIIITKKEKKKKGNEMDVDEDDEEDDKELGMGSSDEEDGEFEEEEMS